jgi:hypothetical protein
MDEAYKYVKDTTIYGRFKLWHLVAFMVLGPTLTWPMLVLLLLAFGYENRNVVKDVRDMININGYKPASSGSSGGNQVPAQGSAQGQVPA